MRDYFKYEIEVAREIVRWEVDVTKKHIAKELIGAAGTVLAALAFQRDFVEALYVGLVALAAIFLLTLFFAAVLAPFRLWQRHNLALELKGRELEEQRARNERRPTQDALDTLAELLSEGIHTILNAAVLNQRDVNRLVEVSEDWNRRLFAHLDAHFPRADALLIQRLGTIQPRQFPGLPDPRRLTILSHFSRREELIRLVLTRGPRA